MEIYNEKEIKNFSGTKMIVSADTAKLIAKSFKLKYDLINHLGSGLIKVFVVHGKNVYVDTTLKSNDHNVYNEFYSPLITLKK